MRMVVPRLQSLPHRVRHLADFEYMCEGVADLEEEDRRQYFPFSELPPPQQVTASVSVLMHIKELQHLKYSSE
jgi:hypothetical protein